jgi:hypothetical protein
LKFLNHVLKYNKTELFSVFLVWFLFTSVSPFEFYAIIPYHPYKIIPLITVLVFGIYFYKNKTIIKNDSIIIIISIQIIYSVLAPFIHHFSLENFKIPDGEIYIKLVIHLLVILFTYIFVKSSISFRKLSYTFVFILSVMAILGFFTLIAIAVFDLKPFSYTVISDHRPISNFITMFRTGNSLNEDGTINILRSSGYFDEPGTFAFYLVVALVLNKLYGFSKTFEKILIIFGMCTLSLAYMISLVFYFIFYGLYERKFKRIIFVFTLTFVSLIYIHNIGSASRYDLELRENNQITFALYSFTTYRLETDNTKNGAMFNGDNRSENMKYSLEAFKTAPLFGLGASAHTKDRHGFAQKLCCNPFHPLATEGLVGFSIYFILFFLWGFNCFKGKSFDTMSFIGWSIIFINLLQRPGFSSGPFGYFAYILLFQATNWRKSIKI